MERIKTSKHFLLPFVISVVLFIIPLLWLNPGEMDLGGDSSRLYFYDPVSYLRSSTLYGVSASSFGLETINYMNLPFVVLLIVLKFIFSSPTVLISVFHGFSLSMGFIFIFLIVNELIDKQGDYIKVTAKYYAAVLAGLLYAFSPALLEGWEHVLLSRNQIFLNPLIFYLMLMYFKTNKLHYILITIIITFIFSPNFSIISSPAIFAFYPVSILFLILYTKLVLKKRIVLWHLALGVILFLGVQSFHLIPQISSILSPGNDTYSTIFSDDSKFNRGLSYFLAIAPNIKISINLLGFTQMKELNTFANLFFIFPFIMVFSLIYNKSKTTILTAVFFLVVLFFATANITNLGFSIYKGLFGVPGFSMFRNFYGQWQYAYIFFYTIFFAQALYILLDTIRIKKRQYLLLAFLSLILTINAWAFIRGELIRQPLWQSKNVIELVQMDQDYVKALSFMNSLPADARVLTLPMTDPGYQIISGKNGGAYMGPSTIAYLAGKKDFAGIDEFQEYKDLVSYLVRNRRYDELRKLLGFLNIKYIFYNADPVVYDMFPSFPYSETRKVFPQDQKLYAEFVKHFQYKEIKNINNKFFVYELKSDEYVPQIFAAKKTKHFNRQFSEINIPISIYDEGSRIAVTNNPQFTSADSSVDLDEILIDIQDKSSFSGFFVNSDYSVGFPYAFSAWKLDSWVYPLVALNERKKLSKQVDDTNIELAILLADKRIGELERWGEDVPLLNNVKNIASLDKSWKEPGIFSFYGSGHSYNSWEVGLLRYRRQIIDLIEKLEKSNNSRYSIIGNKMKLNKAITSDQERFNTIISENEKFSKKDKVYLFSLVTDMFDEILGRLQFKLPSPEYAAYNLQGLDPGEYEILLEKNSLDSIDPSKVQVVTNNSQLLLKDFSQDSNWYRGKTLSISKNEEGNLKILYPQLVNLVPKENWKTLSSNYIEKDNVVLATHNVDLPNEKGLIANVDNWKEGSYYLLSFDYLTHGGAYKLRAFDNQSDKDQEFKKILEFDLTSTKWQSFEVLFSSSKDANIAFIQALKQEHGFSRVVNTVKDVEKIEMRNFSIVRIPHPKIVLRKVSLSNGKDMQVPNITFTKINPTKYEIKVEGAVRKYPLVLVNQFNEKWILYDNSQENPNIWSHFSIFTSRIGTHVASFLNGTSFSQAKVQQTYFNGEIKENSISNSFFDKNIFETWGKRSIAVKNHIPVNGNSNMWYIKPEDMQGRTNYTLILEISTQKIFYFSLFVSVFTLFITVAILVKCIVKNK